VQTRKAVTSGIGWLRERGERAGLNPGPVGAWTRANKRLLRIGVVALAALIFVFWGQPTVAVAVWIVIVLLVVLGLIELIGGGRAGDAGAGGTGAGGAGITAQS
jgi:fatty acid desaturase